MTWLLVTLPIVGAFVAWILGRVAASRRATAESWKMAPTPESARVAVEIAVKQEQQTAQEKAKAVENATDDDVQRRIDQLRERGRAGK